MEKKKVKIEKKKKLSKQEIRMVALMLGAMEKGVVDIEERIVKRIFKMWDHLLSRVNESHENLRNSIRNEQIREHDDMREKHNVMRQMMHTQFINIADDTTRIEFALRGMIQMIENIIYTPEVRERIIKHLTMNPGAIKK